MNGRTASVLMVAAILVLVGVVVSSPLRPSGQNQPLISSSTGQSTASSSSSTSGASGVTLNDLIAGKFPTALDKRGTGGVAVTVQGLYVLGVQSTSDGDWHVTVTDGKVRVFITEITPQYQDSLGRPVVGSTIDETGIAYCDTFHENESWHGSTCWEIHPVTYWQASSRTLTVTSALLLQGIYAQVSYAQNPIPRGSTQTITVKVVDSDGPAPGKVVYIHVVYASGATVREFMCTTDTDGTCSASWKIGSTSTPGTFTMVAYVDGVQFFSSFEVTA